LARITQLLFVNAFLKCSIFVTREAGNMATTTAKQQVPKIIFSMQYSRRAAVYFPFSLAQMNNSFFFSYTYFLTNELQ
jgi:hypothetical protein